MIALMLDAHAEAQVPFVTKLRRAADEEITTSTWIGGDRDEAVFAGRHGLVVLDGVTSEEVDGDVVLVDPGRGRAERVIRSGSQHNTLLVTERCDQLCVMCSQPPKKTHDDRFALFEQACMLAAPDSVIGISGGEPTLYKEELLGLAERVLDARPDMELHILSNGQHFEASDVGRLRAPAFRRVTWGIPLYSADPATHDGIVAKPGAFERLMDSFAQLLMSGARVELRTVLLQSNVDGLASLARLVTRRLRFVETWSIMQLENAGFARNRWDRLYVDHRGDFAPIAAALDVAVLHGVPVSLFNFARCTVPPAYRPHAAASISDWKRKLVPACEPCSERDSCSGFFEWHSDPASLAGVTPL